MAVCLAMGAGRVRLVRQGLAEALLLAAAGGAGGLALAWWGSGALVALVSAALPVTLEAGPDARVLAFTTVVSCLTAIVFGLAPALGAARIDPLPALKIGGPGRGAPRLALRRVLVVTQIAVSLILLVCAGLFVRSLLALQDVDPGFDPNRVLLLQVSPPVADPAMPAEERRNLYRSLIARAATVPGVAGASASFPGVFTRDTWRNAVAIEGLAAAPGPPPRSYVNAITPDYFEVMRLALLRGRPFTDDDRTTTALVAAVNATFARQHFGDADPIGRRVALCTSHPCETSPVMREIVGVSEDAKYGNLREDRRPMLYVPFTQHEQSLREIEVRTAGDPAGVAAALHRELGGVDHRLAIVSMSELRARIDASMVAERLIAGLAAAFGLLALGLAATGLYGVVAYVTAQRTGEIGVRMALGASRRDVRRLVLRDTLTLAGIGAMIGVPAALAGARLLGSQLYQVGPADPLALWTGLALLSLATLAATYLPVRRAVRVDPAMALRAE
jgi:predicted permease